MIKQVKKILLILLTAVLLCASVCTANAAGSYFNKDGFYFGVKNGEAYIHGSDGNGWDIVIPEMFLKYYVTEVEEYAFYENQSIEVLSFYEASHLYRLGDGAFSYCPKLKKVHITETIQEMGVGVFEGCAALNYVRFRDGALTDIPAQSFYGCGKLQTVVFDNELTSIGKLAFANCPLLAKIEIPDSVTYIAADAFDGCENLVIYCKSGSYALQYAIEHNVDYVITDVVTYMIGDASGDGSVSINDVTTIQRYLAELETLEGIYLHAADVNQDGTVDIADATVIQMYLAEYEMEYPIGEVMTQ